MFDCIGVTQVKVDQWVIIGSVVAKVIKIRPRVDGIVLTTRARDQFFKTDDVVFLLKRGSSISRVVANQLEDGDMVWDKDSAVIRFVLSQAGDYVRLSGFIQPILGTEVVIHIGFSVKW